MTLSISDTTQIQYEPRGGAVSTCCRYPAQIFENMQEEGVSISIGSGWKPLLMGSRRRAPSQGAGASWCRLVWALCHHTLGQQASWLLTDAYPPRKGWILSKAGRYSSHSTCISFHTQPCNPGPEGGCPTCVLLSVPTFSFPTAPNLVQALTSPPASSYHGSLCQHKSHYCPVPHAFQEACKALSLVCKQRSGNSCPVLGCSLSLPEKPA